MNLSDRVYNAITNTGPRTNNARALADEVAKMERVSKAANLFVKSTEPNDWVDLCEALKDVEDLLVEEMEQA